MATGYIDIQTQFIKALTAFIQDEDDSQLEVLFKIYDRDGNGFIDREDLKATLVDLSFIGVVIEAQVNSMMEQTDTNKNQKISIEEFKAFMKKNRDE